MNHYKDRSLITIVIPVKDRAHLVETTLDSVAAQTYRPLSLILVDNNSKDNTREILNKWAERNATEDLSVKVIDESVAGASAARNKGLSEVTTPYVMFFDSDDIMLPGHVERIVKTLDIHPDSKLIYWDIAIIDPEGWLTIKSPHRAPLIRSHIFHGTLSTQRMIVATDEIRRVGGWNSRLRQWDDLELGLRLLLSLPLETTHYLTGEPTVRVYPQTDSLSGQNYKSVADNLLFTLDIMATDIDNSVKNDDERRRLQSYIDMRKADIAGHLMQEGEKEKSAEIMREILSTSLSGRDALILRLSYLTVRIFGRGGFILAPYIGPAQPKVSKPSYWPTESGK